MRPPVIARSPTSDAVSKPRPNSRPSGYICQLWLTIRSSRPPNSRLRKPRRDRSSSRWTWLCCPVFAWRHTLRMSEQDDEVEDPDEHEERAGDAGADEPAEALQFGQLLLDASSRQRRCPRRAPNTIGRVPQRKEEADAKRPLALLQHESHRVVDGRDVVGVERVPQPEHVRDEPQPHQRGMVRGIVEIESPSRHVQQRDDAVQSRESPPLGRGEGNRSGGARRWPGRPRRLRRALGIPLSAAA